MCRCKANDAYDGGAWSAQVIYSKTTLSHLEEETCTTIHLPCSLSTVFVHDLCGVYVLLNKLDHLSCLAYKQMLLLIAQIPKDTQWRQNSRLKLSYLTSHFLNLIMLQPWVSQLLSVTWMSPRGQAEITTLSIWLSVAHNIHHRPTLIVLQSLGWQLERITLHLVLLYKSRRPL